MTKKNGDLRKIKRIHVPKNIPDRLSDNISSIFGSWWFISILTIGLITWVILNTVTAIKHWDQYPFILLNLFLSIVAAVFGPIILMSQNREARITKKKADLDYKINRKAEREVANMQRDLDDIKRMLKRDHKKKK